MISYFKMRGAGQDNEGQDNEDQASFEMKPIGWIQSPYKDKYGVPRQPQLAQSVLGRVKFRDDPELVSALKSIHLFSHLWLIFVFHQHGGKNWKPSIRPPRLGGREKVGVLASRSPHRPNPLGLSVVKIEEVHLQASGGAEMVVSGLDMIDGTPVLDVKPYLPYADIRVSATGGWAEAPIAQYSVLFAPEVEAFFLTKWKDAPEVQAEVKSAIREILQLDPRPGYQQRKFPMGSEFSLGKRYGMRILDYEVKYSIQEQGFLVEEVYLYPPQLR